MNRSQTFLTLPLRNRDLIKVIGKRWRKLFHRFLDRTDHFIVEVNSKRWPYQIAVYNDHVGPDAGNLMTFNAKLYSPKKALRYMVTRTKRENLVKRLKRQVWK